MDLSINKIKYKGGNVVLHDGYKYHKKTQYKNGNILWRCSFWRKCKCGGSLTLKEVGILWITFFL